MPDLGPLLRNNKILAAIDSLEGLNDPIETKPSAPARLHVESGGASLNVFNQTFTGSGSAGASAVMLGKSEIDIFGTGVKTRLGDDNTGKLEFFASFGLETSQSFLNNGKGVSVSGSLGAAGHVRYTHYRPLKRELTRLQALRSLAKSSCLPHHLDLSKNLQVGEVHRLDAKLDLDFGLEAKFGYEFAGDTALELAGDISTPLKFDIEAALKASLGLSMFEHMTLTVARAGQLDPENDWIRLRLQRQNERKLSFGATFALDLEYDFGHGLLQLFEEALDQVPIPRLVTMASEVTSRLATEDWKTVKSQLGDTVTDTITDYLDDTGWRELAASNDKIKKLIRTSREIVKAYDGLDDRVASLWDRFLTEANLEQNSKIRKRLAELSKLPDADLALSELLAGKGSKWLLALEILSGRSLEQMVLAGDLQDEVQRVAVLAQQALDFIDGTPQNVLDDIQDFAERTGIEKAIETLRGFQNVEALQATVSARVQDVAERIAGKALDQIDAADFRKIQKFAGRVLEWIPDPHTEGTKAHKLVRDLKKHLEEVRVEYGLSISLEIERVTRKTALLDIELNPRNTKKFKKLRHSLSEAVRFGDARGAYEQLAGAVDLVETEDPDVSDQQEADLKDVPFLLRESAFTSERIRSTAVSIVFDLVGLGKVFHGKSSAFTRRTEQKTIRVVDRLVTEPSKLKSPRHKDPERFHRAARYAAGFQRGSRAGDLTAETALWLVSEDQGSGLKLNKPYNLGDSKRFLRASLSLESPGKKNELEAITVLLHQLGYEAVTASGGTAGDTELDLEGFIVDPSRLIGKQTRFTIDLQFPIASLRAFLKLEKDETAWNRAFINAAHRWAAEGFVSPETHGLSHFGSNGEVLQEIYKSNLFLDHWHSVGGFFGSGEVMDAKRFKVKVRNKVDGIEIGRQGKPKPLTGFLISTMTRRKQGYDAIKDLAQESLKARNDKAYSQLSRQFVRTANRSIVRTMRWPNPSFSLWLWISGLVFTDPTALEKARGLATLRWRDSANDHEGEPKWQGPAVWTVDGIPPTFVPSVFPIQDA